MTNPEIRHQKGKTNLDFNEARGGSGISWAICKSFAADFRQITMPAPHHSIFTGQMLFLTPNQQCQTQKASKHDTENP